MNIFSKSAKKSLVWKALNVLVVFSLVSSYALPLVPTVRAEEGVDVTASDSPSVESSESNDENRDDIEVSEENGSSEEASEEENNEVETATEEEITDDTTNEVEVTDDTSEEVSEGGESSNTNEEEGSVLGEVFKFTENTNGNGGGSGSIWTTDGSCGANQQNQNTYEAGDHVFINGSNFDAGLYNWDITGQPGSSDPNIVVASGTDFLVGANGEFCFDAYTVLAGDDGVYKAQFGNKNDNYNVDEEVCDPKNPKDEDCEPVPQTGSLRICKVTVDEEGDLNSQDIVDGAIFTIEGNSAPTIQYGLPTGTIPTSTFDTPLTLNTNLFGDDLVNDAECVTYTGLSLASPGYYYKAETISPLEGWNTPLYNDQFGIPNIVSEGDEFEIGDYNPFSGELFDENASNDEERNQKSDGHITLSVNRPDRTIVVVNRYEEPIDQCEEATFSVVSDTTATVVENSNANAVATTTHPAWTANIPGATWIWQTLFVENPTQNEIKTFEKTFNVDGVVLDADLMVAADNQYKVWINGTLIGEDATEFNYSATGQDTYNDINPTYFVNGPNTLKMEVLNMAGDQNPLNNPAGALFKLDLKTEDCGGGNQCSEKIMARVVVTDFQNIGAGGNITSDVYVGGNTNAHKYASGEWFEIYDGTNWITDPNIATFHNVPGLAIRRMNGKIQVRDIGPFIYANPKPQEHIEGYIEFQNASALSQENDLIAPIDSHSNGVKLIKDTEDEMWIDGGKSYFWMTTSTGNDGFYTNISDPIVDDCSEPTSYCGDGIVDQELEEECDAGPNGSETCSTSCEIIEENPVCNPEINLIANGSFEAPEVVANSGDWEIVPSLTSGLEWIAEYLSLNPNPGLELQAGYSGWTPKDGNQFAELDGNESTKIYQDINTVVGETYTINYSFSPRPGVASNMLSVSVAGVEVDTQSADGSLLLNTSWVDDSVSFVATSTSTRIAFQNNDTSDSLGTFVDNVSVTCSDEDPAPICGNEIVEAGEACDGGEDCTEQCTIDDGGNGGSEEETQCSDGQDNDQDGFVDYPNDPGCTDASDDDESDSDGSSNGGGNGGGGSSGSSSRSGSRSSSSGDGEVLGAKTTDGEVLGETLAQTGVDFSPISFTALIAFVLFVIARRKEDKKLALN